MALHYQSPKGQCPSMTAPECDEILTCLPDPAQHSFLKLPACSSSSLSSASYGQLSSHSVALPWPLSTCCFPGAHATLDIRFLLMIPKCRSTVHISFWTYRLPHLTAHSTCLLEVQVTIWNQHPTQNPGISSLKHARLTHTLLSEHRPLFY